MITMSKYLFLVVQSFLFGTIVSSYTQGNVSLLILFAILNTASVVGYGFFTALEVVHE